MNRTLLLMGHPSADSFNAALAQAYAEASPEGVEVERLDLGALRFDPILREGFASPQALEPDLLAARAAIERADHLVWVFPTWWAGPPALVRGFVERVFLPHWAFRYDQGQALPVGLLAGKSARVITTMDSPWWWYGLSHRRALHRSFVNGTLSFCGVRPVAETTIYSLRELDAAGRARQLERVRRDAARDAKRRPLTRLPAASSARSSAT